MQVQGLCSRADSRKICGYLPSSVGKTPPVGGMGNSSGVQLQLCDHACRRIDSKLILRIHDKIWFTRQKSEDFCTKWRHRLVIQEQEVKKPHWTASSMKASGKARKSQVATYTHASTVIQSPNMRTSLSSGVSTFHTDLLALPVLCHSVVCLARAAVQGSLFHDPSFAPPVAA